MDSAKHKSATGVTNELILSNLSKVASRVRTWLRYPVLPSYNDSEADVKKLAEFASTIPIEKVSLLPYHALGASKYERLGKTYSFVQAHTPSKEHLEKLARIIESFGLSVTISH